jgi:anti-sigma B factor antagonist
MQESRRFRVALLWPRADLALIVVEGEIDIFTAPRLQESLDEGIDNGAQRLVVDLSAVPFIDSSGLGVFVSGVRRLQPQGGHVDLVCDRANVLRAFEVTGLLGVMGLYATREEALVAAGEPSPTE